MKKGVLYIILVQLLFTACIKDEGENNASLLTYLKENNITNYKTTSSGLIYVIDELGEGLTPELGDTVEVHYTGYFTNDEVFDTSEGKSSFEFVIGIKQVIDGWDEGIALFNVGGSGTIYVPAKLAYGTEDMIFDVSVEGVTRGIAGYTIADYIEANGWENYATTESDIHYRITDAVSEADSPEKGQTVTIGYTGYYFNNRVFDTTSGKSNLIFELGTSNIIEGFNEAVGLLKEGETGDFLLPSDLAYGEEGVPGVFAPNQNIRFTIKLISID